MSEPQTYRNHTRFHPPFHYFVMPVLLLLILFTVGAMVHHWPEHAAVHAILLLLLVVIFTIAGLARGYALKVQDRVIRLEEQLRYQRLLSVEANAAAQALTVRQIIALRFASDAELPALVQRALVENLSAKQIKQAIVTWRPDTFRV